MAKFTDQEASRAVLIEVVNVLGAMRDKFVIVGGWVPDILYPDQGHIGSLDVDLAVQSDALGANQYETLMRRLLDADYRQKNVRACFERDVEGFPAPVKVDIISGQYQQGDKSENVKVDELNIGSLRGVDLAFECCEEMEITGKMPNGAVNKVRARVVRAEAFILIKAFALDERVKAKDAYDVYFILRHYQPDLAALADRVVPLLDNGLAREAWQILQDKFAKLKSVGPTSTADVARDEQGEDYDQIRQAAFQYAQALFDAVGNIRSAGNA